MCNAGGADSAVPPSPLSLLSRPSPQDANIVAAESTRTPITVQMDDLSENMLFGDDDTFDMTHKYQRPHVVRARRTDEGNEADSDGLLQQIITMV
jgi:hypothetical protein